MEVANTLAEWDSSRFLKGPPTEKFRDNLHADKYYITAWSNAGFTNQFMSYVNMIFLGIISQRVPIIPPFGPDHHISYDAGALPFGRIFNLTRARKEMHQPLLEWLDVKHLPSATSVEPPQALEREQLGCWSGRHENDPRPSRVKSVVDNIRLDISYTRAPRQARHNPDDGQDDFLEFNSVVRYIFPRSPLPPPNGHYPLMEASPLGHKLPPDEQMTCFDHLYYATSSPELYEWRFSWSPAWNFVGTHLHFTDDLVTLVKDYLRRVFSRTEDDTIPPFIAIHMRRGDFARQCYDTPGNCLIPLGTFERKVNAMKQEIRDKNNIEITQVLVIADEKDPDFWDEVREIGWVHFDHMAEGTEERYGEWYPPIVDIVAQSMASGFIGTEDSTFSLVSSRRVEDWNKGPAILIARPDRQESDFNSKRPSRNA
ncbi:hypothetical protein BDZ97DRAFT_1649427 [Flammula alnicola]|nr:hypothetical protein BDZ97DRAFT_1649427 [Flammula alnicola]